MTPRRRRGTLAGGLLFFGLLAAPGIVLAQAEGGGHMGHHPGAGAPMASSPNASSSPSMPSGAGGGMGDMMGAPAPPPPSAGPAATPAPSAPPGGGMGGMSGAQAAGGGCGMGCMGGGPKAFYPALMDMPSLTPEARRFIEAEAARRLGLGSEAITTGQMPLHQALSSNNPVAMRQAIAGVREGVFQAESGASALQAVNEAQPPRQIALTWFKGQMSVPAAGEMVMEDGPWGLSWLHVTTMAFLVAFLTGALLIHFARTRRIKGLVERLTPAAAAAASLEGKPKPAPSAGAGAAQAVGAPKADGPKKPWSGALRVAAIFRETPTVKTFRLQNPDGGDIPFTFLPGQFLTFSAKIDDKTVRRSYTIASSPAQRDYVELTIKREEQGAESRYLHDHIAVGDHLEVSGPSGVFTFSGKETDSIVLISGGVGITPMMCILRYLTDCGYRGDIFFLHGTRTADDFIFREELEYLRKRHANAHVAVTLSDEDVGTSWLGARGYISKAFIAQTVPEIARRRVHVCGPPAMMQAVKAELLELGVVKDKIKTEAFGPAQGAAPAPAEVSATAPASPVPTAEPAAPAPPAAAAPSAQVEVQFKKSGKSGPLAPDKCVLEAAEAIGVAIDFSCRVGTCGTCVVPLLGGSVTMAEESGLPPEEKARGIILACQAKSAGALVVDA